MKMTLQLVEPLGFSLAALLGASVFITILVLALIYNDRAVGTRRRKDLPGEKGLPLVGNLLLNRRSMHYRLEKILERAEKSEKESGQPIFHGSMIAPGGALETIFTMNVKDLERVFKDPWNYVKGSLLAGNLKDLLGHGIFVSDGDRWSQQRKTASNIFNLRNFRDVYSPEFNAECNELSLHLDKCAENGYVIDLYDMFHRCTFDSFSRLALGKDFGVMAHVIIESAEADLVQEVTQVLQSLKKPVAESLKRYTLQDEDFMRAFDTLNGITIFRNLNPFWRYTEVLTGTSKQVRKCKEIISNRAGSVIAEKRLANKYGSGERQDLLDFFFEQGNPDGSELTNEQAQDVVMNFLIAGRDTSAQTLSWLFWELAKHPDVEEKLREEAFRVLGQDGVATYESLKDLKYTNAVLNEALRLHPNVPMGRKFVLTDDVLPGTGTKVYAGNNVAYCSWAMGRLESLWGKDAKEFQPERWLDKDGNVKRESSFKHLAFNAGPRMYVS
jgi:cytochrome P450